MSWQRLEQKPPWTTPKITDAWSHDRYILVCYEDTHWTLYLENLYLGTTYEAKTPEQAVAWAGLTIDKYRRETAAPDMRGVRPKPKREFTPIKVKRVAVGD